METFVLGTDDSDVMISHHNRRLIALIQCVGAFSPLVFISNDLTSDFRYFLPHKIIDSRTLVLNRYSAVSVRGASVCENSSDFTD